ncbi:MAG: HlyD family efflux transporter periplasmic adaptor subunit [Fimbriiglobus sp.]
MARIARYRLARPGRTNWLLILSLVANMALVGGLYYLFTNTPATSTGPLAASTSNSSNDINALGRLQPASGVVNVFGPPGDRITTLGVKLGEPVRPGQALMSLLGDQERRLAVDTLDAQIRESQMVRNAAERTKQAKLADVDAEIVQAKAKVEAELALLDAKVAVIRLQEARAATELARLEKTKREGAPVAEQQLVEVKTLADTAKAELAAIEIQKKKALEQQIAGEAAAKAKRATLEAETERLIAQIPTESLAKGREMAMQKLALATVTAPIAGRVVKMNARVGDTTTTMPLLQVAETSSMNVIAEVYETDIPRLRTWQNTKPVIAEIDARLSEGTAAGKLMGEVVSISPMIAKNTVFALGPREDADRRVVEVEIKLDDASSRLAADFIGLQVRVILRAAK